MSPHADVIVNSISGFPRVSGDEPILDAAARAGATFSPRERG